MKFFYETLGVYPHNKFHIDTHEKAELVQYRAYPVPQIQLETFKERITTINKVRGFSTNRSDQMGFTIINHTKEGWTSNLDQ